MSKVASTGAGLAGGTRRLWRSWWACEWATIVVVIAIDLICAAVTGLQMESLRSGYPVMVALMIGIWAILSFGSRLTGLGHGTAWIGEMPTKLSLALAGLATLQYYAVWISAQTPLADELLIRIDHVMGFDWLTVCRWLASHPPVARILMLAYEALLPEAAVIILILVFVAPDRARRFATALVVSLLPTVAILWLLPVEGAFAHYQISSPPDFVVTFQKLRLHELTAIPSVSDGIVSFPSYHACAAVLLSYFVRHIPIAFPAAVTVNAIMIAATPLFGGHYLADVLAGIVVAAATIAFLERQARSDP